jgi:hypothetical protein
MLVTPVTNAVAPVRGHFAYCTPCREGVRYVGGVYVMNVSQMANTYAMHARENVSNTATEIGINIPLTTRLPL